jgi:predicted aminopeptidase
MDSLVTRLSFVGLFFITIICAGCQIPYLVKSSYNQLSLLSSRVPLEKALNDPGVSDEEKRKLRLSKKVREFATTQLHLKESKNYTSFVKLDRPSVSYVVNASAKWELKHYEWWFPIVGKMPYKGFFNEQDAKDEEKELKAKGLDTYLRGVSAYSTLGWFNDPILSSMLIAKDFDLVNTLIHETVHATLYIKNSADFNERMAVFLGNKGMELFYLQEEGPDSETLKEVRLENQDQKLFSHFITQEIKELEVWYKTQSQTSQEKNEETRLARLAEINSHFVNDLQPQLKSKAYGRFANASLNNARLLLYKTYDQDLADFEELYQISGKNFEVFLKHCRELEKHPKPEQGLKELLQQLKRT